MANDKQEMGLPKSKVGGVLAVTSQTWVISMVRIPEGKYPEHIFLLLEGINGEDKPIVRRYDLIEHDKRKGYAKVLILPMNEKEADVATVASLTKGQKVCYQSWHISPSQAEKLYADVFNDYQEAENLSERMLYSVFGDGSYSAYSSSHHGHNCFTWAREKLSKLGDTSITNSIKSKITDCLVAQPSLYLPDSSDSWFNIKNIAIGVVGVVVASAVARGFFSGTGNLPSMPSYTGVTPLPPTPLPSASSTLNHLDVLSTISRNMIGGLGR